MHLVFERIVNGYRAYRHGLFGMLSQILTNIIRSQNDFYLVLKEPQAIRIY